MFLGKTKPYLAATAILFLSPFAWGGTSEYTIQKMDIKGLQRLTLKRVISAVDLKQGDTINRLSLQKAIADLYETGYFEDIQVQFLDGTLYFELIERPIIDAIELQGHKSIPKETLLESLKQLGLEKGRIFNPIMLDRIQTELDRQYMSQGRYEAKIKTRIESLSGNRVSIHLDVEEGTEASIAYIDLLGNTFLSDEELLDKFQLSKRHWYTFFTGKHKYAKEKLAADLEMLRQAYLNKGFLDFSIDETQVSLTAKKDQIYIDLKIFEGKQYILGKSSLSGDYPKTDEKQLQTFLILKEGEIFSQKKIVLIEQAIQKYFADQGYLFADVKAVPKLNREKNQADLVFFIQPKKKMYIREINFQGNNRTAEVVLRRQVRQMEGQLANRFWIERSRERLNTLGFFKNIQIIPRPVSQVDDLVDLDISFEEQESGTISASIGYQGGGTGLIFNAGVSQKNFLGTGNQVSFSLERTDETNRYSFNFLDPFYTKDGVSRGYGFYFRETDYTDSDISSYRTNSYGANLSFGYPLTEHQDLQFSFAIDNSKIFAGEDSAPEIKSFVGFDQSLCNSGRLCTQSENFLTYSLTTSWSRNTLNRGLLPDAGNLQRVSFEISVPGSDLNYHKFLYRAEQYLDLSDPFKIRLKANLGYGAGYGDTDILPFYKHFYAGGAGSVRGYQNRTLGPKDSLNEDPFGGNLLTDAGIELIVPTPFVEDQSQIRSVLFADAGNVFNTKVSESNFDWAEIRGSVGVGLTWMTFVGPLSFTLSRPIQDQSDDDVRRFDFTIGQFF